MSYVPSDPNSPFGPSGIDDALARNRALGEQQKSKFNFGDFLAAWAGNLGDNLTGNPAYANAMKARAEGEAQEAENRRQQEWWYEQQRYKAENEKPDRPGIADQFDWYRGAPPELKPEIDRFIQMMNPGQSSPVNIPYGSTVQGGGGGIPSVTSPQEAAQLPPGTQFRLPDGRIGTVPKGGPSPQGSGGFRY